VIENYGGLGQPEISRLQNARKCAAGSGDVGAVPTGGGELPHEKKKDITLHKGKQTKCQTEREKVAPIATKTLKSTPKLKKMVKNGGTGATRQSRKGGGIEHLVTRNATAQDRSS